MRFSVEIDNENVSPVIFLKDGESKTKACIYSFGALLNNFFIIKKDGKEINLIDAYTSPNEAKENITNGFKSAKLSPFAGRIENAKYSFEGKENTLSKFSLGKEALHGLLFDAQFSIIDYNSNADNAFVTLEYSYNKKDEGFPFAYTCRVEYSLQPRNKLTVTTTVINNSDENMPLCDGWHPYFKFDQNINNLLLKVDAEKMVELNEKLVPSKKIITNNLFTSFQKVGDIHLDNCFLLKPNTEIACIVKDEKNNILLNVIPDESYPYLQIYTPDNRKSIAIENISAAPNAFNNEIGLTVLSPSTEKRFTTTFQVEIE